MLPRPLALTLALCLLAQSEAPNPPREKPVDQMPPPATAPRAIEVTQERIGEVALSPDGRTIAFAAYDADDRAHIYLVAADGGAANALTSGACNDISPKFSPDGGQIAFVSDRTGNAEIHTVAVTGGMPRQVTNDPGQ